MKQKINIIRTLLLIVSCASIPLLHLHQATNQINPYHLTGKEFLPFFVLLSFLSAVIAVGWLSVLKTKSRTDAEFVPDKEIPQPQHCISFVLLIGVVRLIQGISNEKPVGYLVMLLLADVVAFFAIRFSIDKARKTESKKTSKK